MLNERNTLLEDDGIEEEILVEEECSVAQAMWGDVGGNIENQTDLQNALDAKQDSLTEAQLSAVNSGITSEKVTTYDGYADQIASKADQSALNAESTARGEADTALGTRIDNEALARQQADNGLQSQIDAITSKSDVVDVVANYAALQAYDTSTLGNNDVVKVLDDETHEDALTYYRWSTTTQTWAYIGQEAPYYSKGQMDTKLAEKQDKLTAGANIQIQNGTISAIDTTYTAGNGLNLNGTEFSANTDVLATKEDLEGYYTKPETDKLLAPKLEAEVVAELPTTGEEGKLYLTPKNYTRGTGTGNPITATITDEAGAIESFQLDGDTEQQTYTGKNLMIPKASAQEKTGITITPNSDGSFTLDGTATTATDFYFAGSWSNRTISYLDMPSGDYTISLLDSAKQQIAFPKFRVELYDRMGENSTRILWLQQSAASPQTTTIARFAQVTASYISIPINQSFTNEKFYIQLEKGSAATSFEKYVGGTPSPNPDYPQAIQTVTGLQTVEIIGKNLFDGVTTHQLILSDGTISNNGNWNLGGYIKVSSNTTYTVSFKLGSGGSHSVLVSGFDSNKDFLVRAGSQGNAPYTFTTSSTTEYIRLNYNNTNNDTDFQVELGSTASAYTPYSLQTLPLDLGDIQLCGLGDDGSGNPLYKDRIYKDGEDWKVHKETIKKAFSDSTKWLWDGTIPRLSANATTWGIVAPPNANTPVLGVSNKFKAGPFWYVYNQKHNGFAYSTSGFLSVVDKSWESEEDARAAFAGTTFYFAAAAPTDTAITDTTLIAQLEAIRTALLQNGTNIITNTATGTNLAGDMEIGYFGFNPTNRYDKFIWLDLNNNYEQIGGE